MIRRPQVLLLGCTLLAGAALGVGGLAGAAHATVPDDPAAPDATEAIVTDTTVPETTVAPGDVPDGSLVPDETDQPASTDPDAGLPATVPVPSLPVIEDPNAVSAPLVPIPAGCAAPRQEQAVFVGTLVTRDAATARFIVGRVRAGTVAGFTVAGLIDVRYGNDVQYLDVGQSYLVGAAIDEDSGVLASAVRAPAPGFGGSEVASVGATDVDCPEVDDPVRTLLLDGTPVESGVLAPLKGAKRKVLRAILQPVIVALLVLVGLSTLKLLVFAAGRSIRDVGQRRPVALDRVRRLDRFVTARRARPRRSPLRRLQRLGRLSRR